MLTLTENASTVVKTLTGRDGAADDAGLRIASSSPDALEYSVAVVATPAEADTIVESDGARVFLEPDAARSLDDKILDADVSTEGGVRFSVVDAPAN